MAAETEVPTYRVTSPYVNVKVAGNIMPTARGGGYVLLGYYKDSLLPRDVHPDDIERLLSAGYIEAVA